CTSTNTPTVSGDAGTNSSFVPEPIQSFIFVASNSNRIFTTERPGTLMWSTALRGGSRLAALACACSAFEHSLTFISETGSGGRRGHRRRDQGWGGRSPRRALRVTLEGRKRERAAGRLCAGV